jgi:Arc/MetJ family transcription regulator
VTRLAAEEQAVRAQVAAEIHEAMIDRDRAVRALRIYDRDVLRALEENLGLLRRMLAAGKASPAEVIVLQRELLEGRLGYLEARLDLATADARARTAVGLPLLDDATGGGP